MMHEISFAALGGMITAQYHYVNHVFDVLSASLVIKHPGYELRQQLPLESYIVDLIRRHVEGPEIDDKLGLTRIQALEHEVQRLRELKWQLDGIGGVGSGSIKALSIISDLRDKNLELTRKLDALRWTTERKLPFRIQFLDDDPAIVLVFDTAEGGYISEPITLHENDDIVNVACTYAVLMDWFNNPPK